MAIIDFEPKLSWYDLTPEEVHSLAHMENDARRNAHDLIYGIDGDSLNGIQRMALAEAMLQDQDEYADKFLGRLATAKNLGAEISTQPIKLSPEAEVRAKLPLLFSDQFKNMNPLKAFRIASGYRGEDGKRLRLREVAKATGYTMSHTSRLENDERWAGPEVFDHYLAYYCGLNDIEGAAKVVVYQMFTKELGHLALQTE